MQPQPIESLGLETLAMASGGAIGASLRYAIVVVAQASDQHAAMATSAANLTGAFLLGLLAEWLDSATAHPLARPFLVVGVFGGFTTFSALAYDNRSLAGQHGEIVALLHISLSMLVGLMAFAGGIRVVRRVRGAS